MLLDRRARWVDDGRALLGGAPPRLVRLSARAREVLPPPGAPLVVEGPTHRALARTLLDAGLAHPVPARAGTAPVRAGPTAAEVTVVIPVKDRPVDRLLAALARDGLAAVVVDDGSADPAPLRRAARAAGATLLRHATPRGPAAARNAGLAAAMTPFVAFLDSDVVPEPGWLPPLLAHLADPAVGLVAPRIVALDPGGDGGPHGWHGLRGLVGRYEAVRSSLDLGPDPAPVVPRSRVAYVPSAALLVRAADVGPVAFDPGMHVAEDVDLVLRLHAAGRSMRFEPASRVAHDHRTSPVQWWRRKAFYGTGAAPLAQRHPGAVPPLVVSPWTAAVCLLLLLQRRGATALAAVVTAVAAERLSRRLTGLRHPRRTAARLAVLGLWGALAQTASALTRHFWPLAALALPFSRRARRAVVVAGIAEGIGDWWRHRDRDPRVRVGPVGYLLAHRLDDLGYGAGLWWGAWRRRTTAPLRPAGPGTARERR
ncbi:mycofactocin biosynthesis glycosyltransferase MftF [Pseudonocardia sp. HH130630-07]|uniref:mycofactocin biosynthesis glycosyltransferase MftF n=1 Tax=Pseudonocardia sp. HH130630-07 TaxID=1690815 RepID=UPI001E5FD051|nr:mycofactocin biosynthesis glycosyltransferase MftF [Pseudonocardia sp. HH130630-07]